MNLKKLINGLMIVAGVYAVLHGSSYVIAKKDRLEKNGYSFSRSKTFMNLISYYHFQDRSLDGLNHDTIFHTYCPFPGIFIGREYWDRDSDGLVDEIGKSDTFLCFSKESNLERNIHLEVHERDFSKADKVLAQQKDKFKDHAYVKQFEKNRLNQNN